MSKKNVTKILFVVYIILLIWIILFKLSFSFQSIDRIRGINLIPFAGSVVANGEIDMDEIINNALIFVPFGIYLSTLFPKWKAVKKELVILGFSILIEVLQYILSVGATDVTDIIMNGVGAGIGIMLYSICIRMFKSKANFIINIFALIGTACFILLLYLIL
ncbi:VanZ family protein [Mediterraneibacter glycyrrhizinilyticus]|uniref:VanZ family protein n=1 Tax=Mediterraneibacter glycyrrhizinilyticus TaxID=342942 RepID=UPI000B3977B8|nr:VanZ family protein [Mediterraneibacter glycyrrhizinilyticus]MBM6750016.1 VanZ family protein [Mediterraneibacter glycyrrhizinilyticus]OUP64281.1 hypothetical protein B5F13_08375 [Drancourtella sp. An177]